MIVEVSNKQQNIRYIFNLEDIAWIQHTMSNNHMYLYMSNHGSYVQIPTGSTVRVFETEDEPKEVTPESIARMWQISRNSNKPSLFRDN
jgi:hypothetical protein